MNEVFLAKGAGPGAKAIADLARQRGIRVRAVDRAVLDLWTAGGSHQGVACSCSPVDYLPFGTLLQRCRRAVDSGSPRLVAVLDGVQDPRNLGAILRTLDAAGAEGVVLPCRRACGITPAVEKASAGSARHVPVCRVPNLARAIESLKETGYWTVGLDAGAPSAIWELDLTGAVALVVGGEDKGIRPLVAGKCDFLASIPMTGHAGSLNVAVACAIAAYEQLRQKRVR